MTAVCSTGKVEQARRLGADRVVDYTKEDFSRRPERYQAIIDANGNRSWAEYRRVLEPGGVLVATGSPVDGYLIGAFRHVLALKFGAIGSGRRVANFIARLNKETLAALRDLVEAGKLKPVVERTYPLDRIPDALGYLGEGHAAGKIVVTVP